MEFDDENVITTDGESTIKDEDNDNLIEIANAYRTILKYVGEDVDREGLLNTPMRAAKALKYFTSGQKNTLENVVGEGVFNEADLDPMNIVTVKNIDVYSLCEHHLIPFFGKVHISYSPRNKILGLSKLARIVELYARRLQVQERLTNQIASAVLEAIDAHGVGVVIEASHMCMVMRGVEKVGSSTVTSVMLGNFKTNKEIRDQFLISVK